MANQIVKAHGGRLELESEPVAEAPSRWCCQGGDAAMSRILIVEDEPSIALALEDDLRREGYETELVSDGDAAVSAGARSSSST